MFVTARETLPEVGMESSGICVRDVQQPGSRFSVRVQTERRTACGWEQHTRQHEEGERERAHLKLLLELASQVVSGVELRDLLRTALKSIRWLISSDEGCVFLNRQGNGELEIYASDFSGGVTNRLEGTAVPIEGTVAGRVFQTGNAWAGTREQALALLPPCDPVLLVEGPKVSCMVPMPGRSRILGTLGLVRRENHPYDQDELDSLAQVSKQLAIAVENVLLHEENRELKKRLIQENVYVDGETNREAGFEEVIGNSEVLRRALRDVELVASTGSTVLICGETGTGKEMIARAIHKLSPRQQKPFVKLNCAAIPTGLLEGELFGHEKGAFTGAATQRIGRFEVADGGTIFLDEVSEIPLELQTKLLRVLQEREFERLGSNRTIRTDARLIAATNRDLSQMVKDQKFRSDLFYRLNVFPIRVPSLRERVQDIHLLVRHFIQHFARRMNKVIDTIPSETMSALAGYSWPGNIRELQNLIERAVILTSGPVLCVPLDDLKNRTGPDSAKFEFQTVAETERALILATLKKTKWVIAGPNGAAERLGMNRSTLQFRMNKLGIVKPWKESNPEVDR
jgi:formate hydrogenlyase transcriptional activator